MSLKIMIVDDEPASLNLMRSLAAPLNHTVLTFDDGQDAGQRADNQRFDVVFMGMHLSELREFELTRRIRNSQFNRETTIVMLSPTQDIPSLRRAFGEGADLVLTKPLSPAHLRPMLTAMDSPGWKTKRQAARLPMFTEVHCSWGDQQFSVRSLNISETGMLLQPSLAGEIGQKVSLEFKIAEIRASLNLSARIIRKEGEERVAVEFDSLAPEDRNAIQVYVLGRMAGDQGSNRGGGTGAWWRGRGFINAP